MTENEWSIVKRLAAFVFVIALFPIGALAYRVFISNDAANDAIPTVTPVLYTLVPDASPVTFSTPKPTSVVVVVPNGWAEYTVADQGFAVSIPTTWQQLPVKEPELAATLDIVRQTNPELATALGTRGQELMQSGVKFWAFDPDPNSLKSKFVTNVTITHRTLPNEVSFDTYLLINLNQINALASRQGDVTHSRITLANLPAEKVRYNLVFVADDGTSTTSTITLYLLLNRAEAYVLTYATRPEQIDHYDATFDQSATSFRFLGQ